MLRCTRTSRVGSGLAVIMVGLVLVSAAQAQSGLSGTIAGVVRDASGAVLPGVTVEAASPALIEKVRAVTTDGAGQYRIVDLRPGTYTVAFSLPGFSTVNREGVELTTGFTATVNADLRVGTLEETVTVTGASPVVDVQNVRGQNVLTRDILESAPIANNVASWVAVTVGATGGGARGASRDVGGTTGPGAFGMSIRGVEGQPMVEGMQIGGVLPSGGGSQIRYAINPLATQEVVVDTLAGGAEATAGGANMNVVLRDGGNTFRGMFNTDYTTRGLQSDNSSDALRARGVDRPSVVTKLYDVGGAYGGPIRTDKLWFFTAHRKVASKVEMAGLYFNKTQDTLFYTPDLSRPGFADYRARDSAVRLTWQAAEKHRIAGYVAVQAMCACRYHVEGASLGPRAPEATGEWWNDPNNLYQATWTYPASDRLLFEAGTSYKYDHQDTRRPPEVTTATIPVQELSTGFSYGSFFYYGTGSWLSDYGDHGLSPVKGQRVSVAYVTGTHAFKTGVTLRHGSHRQAGDPYPVGYQFRNQLPVSLEQTASPSRLISKINYDLGLYGQDQWTMRRLTLNVGLRLDMFNGSNPAQTRPGGVFVAEKRFEEVKNIPNWKDVNPRLGVAYDLFGNGKTAIKGSFGRYVILESTTIQTDLSPGYAIATDTTRTWNDTNGNFFPDCDLTSRVASGECGPMANQNFGLPILDRRYDPDVLDGWHVRQYTWQTSASVTQELVPGFGLRVAYFRNSWGGQRATYNELLGVGDFDPFCVTAPVDSRLPGGGGNEICGLFDVKPEKFGQSSQVTTSWENIGERPRVFNGAEAVLNGRFGRGGFFNGGVAVGRDVTDTCFFNDKPHLPGAVTRTAEFCKPISPLSAATQVKFTAGHPVIWGIDASVVFNNVPGVPQGATAVFTNAQVAPSLGRNLAACGTRLVGCTATVTATIVPPGTMFEERQTQLDLRFSREIAFGAQMRLRPRLDIYNLFNANSVQSLNTRIGAQYLKPSDVLIGRMVKLGAQLDF